MKHDFKELYQAFVAEGFRRKGRLLLYEFPQGIVVVRPSGFRDIFSIFFGIWLDNFEPRPERLSPEECPIHGNASDLCGIRLAFDTLENPDRTLELEERFEKDYAYTLTRLPEVIACLKLYASEDILARAYAGERLAWFLFAVRVRDYLARRVTHT